MLPGAHWTLTPDDDEEDDTLSGGTPPAQTDPVRVDSPPVTSPASLALVDAPAAPVSPTSSPHSSPDPVLASAATATAAAAALPASASVAAPSTPVAAAADEEDLLWKSLEQIALGIKHEHEISRQEQRVVDEDAQAQAAAPPAAVDGVAAVSVPSHSSRPSSPSNPPCPAPSSAFAEYVSSSLHHLLRLHSSSQELAARIHTCQHALESEMEQHARSLHAVRACVMDRQQSLRASDPPRSRLGHGVRVPDDPEVRLLDIIASLLHSPQSPQAAVRQRSAGKTRLTHRQG